LEKVKDVSIQRIQGTTDKTKVAQIKQLVDGLQQNFDVAVNLYGQLSSASLQTQQLKYKGQGLIADTAAVGQGHAGGAGGAGLASARLSSATRSYALDHFAASPAGLAAATHALLSSADLHFGDPAKALKPDYFARTRNGSPAPAPPGSAASAPAPASLGPVNSTYSFAAMAQKKDLIARGAAAALTTVTSTSGADSSLRAVSCSKDSVPRPPYMAPNQDLISLGAPYPLATASPPPPASGYSMVPRNSFRYRQKFTSAPSTTDVAASYSEQIRLAAFKETELAVRVINLYKAVTEETLVVLEKLNADQSEEEEEERDEAVTVAGDAAPAEGDDEPASEPEDAPAAETADGNFLNSSMEEVD